VELNKFVADHDFCLEIKYEEQHQPHVIIEKADPLKGNFSMVGMWQRMESSHFRVSIQFSLFRYVVATTVQLFSALW